jgi:hypothetical protein
VQRNYSLVLMKKQKNTTFKMIKNDFFNKKVSIIVTTFICYYRIFGITFGGLVIRRGKCVVNKNLKIFGNILTISMIIVFIILSRITINNNAFGKLYSSGFAIIYYLLSICREVRDILVIINLYYYQFRSSDLFSALTTYPMKKKKHKIFIFSVIIIHILIYSILAMIYLKFFSEDVISIRTIHVLFLGIYYSIALTVIHVTTWGKFLLKLFRLKI